MDTQVVLSGHTKRWKGCMGVYELVSRKHGGSPVYRNEYDCFLYRSSESGKWAVCDAAVHINRKWARIRSTEAADRATQARLWWQYDAEAPSLAHSWTIQQSNACSSQPLVRRALTRPGGAGRPGRAQGARSRRLYRKQKLQKQQQMQQRRRRRWRQRRQRLRQTGVRLVMGLPPPPTAATMALCNPHNSR